MNEQETSTREATTDQAAAVLTSEQEHELLEVWIPYMRNVVRRLGVPYDLREDITQAAITDILKGGYMDIYDPAKASLNTFLYSFVKKRVYGRVTRRGRDAMRRATPVGDRDWMLDEPADGVDAGELEGRRNFWNQVRKLEARLAEKRRRSRRTPDGQTTTRTNADVLTGLLQGKNQAQIARDLGYSEATVSGIMTDIRNQPEAQALLSMVG